jgi:putative oxidoreductase
MRSIGSFTQRYHAQLYAVFRIFIGLLFAQHGAQKVFGLFTENAAQPILSLMGVVGVLELLGGLLIAVGLLTRVWALTGSIIMIAAYFTAHFPNGWIPVVNRGELALVYLAAFLVLLAHGNQAYSLETLLWKKELA